MKEAENNISNLTPCKTKIRIGRRKVGAGEPVYIVAEVGINHNGDLEKALKLVDAAAAAGCDAVKFQKRSPDICVPVQQRDLIRETPWGSMTYLAYRHKVEFGQEAFHTIDRHCREKGITWFASCWDEASVDFIDRFDPACYKVASACLTDDPLLRYTRSQGKPMILSTGMSTMEQIKNAMAILPRNNVVIVHTTSNYTNNPEELNLRLIQTLEQELGCFVGYSGHEKGAAPTIAAIALGACYVERHITLDRHMWGSDHAISLEPDAFKTMVDDIRTIEKAMGDGVKRVYESEKRTLARLRNCT